MTTKDAKDASKIMSSILEAYALGAKHEKENPSIEEMRALRERLAAAEAVCLYLMGWLLMEPNSRIKELLNQWIKIRDQQELKEKP